ncbi:preprotein translocase subunit SecA [Roseiconus nitratireducens]|uniref:Protein translocase subunit SecA n=1 Tax=Roseiconus nitratireducens TaxID=2605748 RepID=A0A5M6D9U8_9BACT|nr:preprotein translocase subunit SecA [Roseiconus nitratireducens]KAA5542729.1 preprotein translocase subunit SecA [Roseiconus nitratireducens]
MHPSMLSRRSTIASYRSFIGSPLRGVQSVHPMTLRWINDVRRRAESLSTLGEAELRSAADALRHRMRSAGSGPHITSQLDHVIESFALTGEALRRATGMNYYDVQWMGGFVLAAGVVAEIQTGEGKTVTTALPSVLHAWGGRGVHIATTNEYLSRRDYETLLPVYQTLGLSVGHLESGASPEEKRMAYACDLTYGPGYEFGFDFLRDQLAIRADAHRPLGDRYLRQLQGIADGHQVCQRELSMAIVDEADSVLIDEATIPLVLGGGPRETPVSPSTYHRARDMAKSLREPEDFLLDASNRRVALTPGGRQRVSAQLPTSETSLLLTRPWTQMVENALAAEHLFSRDTEYVVSDGKLMIVDPHTGRIHPERTWSRGMHQAVEAKEQLDITAENETQGRVTRQRFMQCYDRVAGLTGTAAGSEGELREFYDLPVVRIPTHRPSAGRHLPTRAFASREEKFRAVIEDTVGRARAGQPVLIGTRTIAESRRLSERFSAQGITHAVLNGVQTEQEAKIVARAGIAATVTVATNMAGRGTDIRLDDAARRAGGLHVASTELQPSARVDRQLAGRSARQGDPGSYQRFVSAEDPLIQAHDADLAARILAAADPSGECRQRIADRLDALQQTIDSKLVEQRRQMVAHDDWLVSVQSALARRA